MKVKNATIIFLIFLIGCSTNKEINLQKIYKNQQISYYKDALMDGKYTERSNLFRRLLGFYLITNYKHGLLDGEWSHFEKGKLTEQVNYINGLKHGLEIQYRNDIKYSSRLFNNGFLWGENVFFEDNGIDTSYTIGYYADPYKMDIYVDTYFTMECDRIFHINQIMQPCIIKADEYPQHYYLKSDSTLIYECIWHRVDSCYHVNKQYGYKD